MNNEEIWQPIRGTKGAYSVSTHGRVRRNAGVITVMKPIRQRVLRANHGRVTLSVDGVPTEAHVETLMHQTFGCTL
jgi:NUMOD4 motif